MGGTVRLHKEFMSSQPDTINGDIAFVLQQKEHPMFNKKGEKSFQFILTHLDNKQLLIKSLPAEVVKSVVGKKEVVAGFPTMEALQLQTSTGRGAGGLGVGRANRSGVRFARGHYTERVATSITRTMVEIRSDVHF